MEQYWWEWDRLYIPAQENATLKHQLYQALSVLKQRIFPSCHKTQCVVFYLVHTHTHYIYSLLQHIRKRKPAATIWRVVHFTNPTWQCCNSSITVEHLQFFDTLLCSIPVMLSVSVQSTERSTSPSGILPIHPFLCAASSAKGVSAEFVTSTCSDRLSLPDLEIALGDINHTTVWAVKETRLHWVLLQSLSPTNHVLWHRGV